VQRATYRARKKNDDNNNALAAGRFRCGDFLCHNFDENLWESANNHDANPEADHARFTGAQGGGEGRIFKLHPHSSSTLHPP